MFDKTDCLVYNKNEILLGDEKMAPFSVSFTGYRPNKFDFDLDDNNSCFNDMENKLFFSLSELVKKGAVAFYSGMAVGFDIIAAESVLLLKKANPEIKLICVLPFKMQSEKYTEEWKNRYYKILAVADKVVILSEKYHKRCYQARNEYMVDNSDMVVTYFDGKKGGTENTLQYAKKNNKRIINLFGNISNFSDIESYVYYEVKQ